MAVKILLHEWTWHMSRNPLPPTANAHSMQWRVKPVWVLHTIVMVPPTIPKKWEEQLKQL